MGRRENSPDPQMELELNLSPPRVNSPVESPNVSTSSSSSSHMSVEGSGSCVSSETVYCPTNHPVVTSMMLVGCPRCLMYVMLSDDVDPKCPKCKSTVLLDFLKEENTNKTRN